MGETVNAKTVRAALGAAQAAGLDPQALAEAHGVAEALTNFDARLPRSAWLDLWRDIIARSGDEAIGIHAAERLPWGHWDVIDYLIGTSVDLGASLRRFERYFAIISTGVRHVVEDHGDAVHLVRRYAAGNEPLLLAPAEFAFATLILHTRAALGTAWLPREIRFAAPAPASDAERRRVFGCPIVFDAQHSAIVIERETLALPTQAPDPSLLAVLERHAETLIAALGVEKDLVARTRRLVMSGLRDADFSVAGVARRLGLSTRTLQRRLQEGGQPFNALVDQTRRELAARYLGDPALSIQEIAYLLAFGDLKAFYRAFRRWEGCTPAEFRRRSAASSEVHATS